MPYEEDVGNGTTIHGRSGMGLTRPWRDRETHVAPDAMYDAEGHGNS
jgi:hypothetical protein